MKSFSLKKINSAEARLLEEAIYQKVANELTNGVRRDGLWAKAIDKAAGNEEKIKGLYIQYRVQALKDETEIDAMAIHEQRIVSAIETIVSVGCQVEGNENNGWRIISLKIKSKGMSWKVKTLDELEAFASAARSL